ncbi:MAG: hypothetical protein ACXV5L_09000 [Thermoanaerobaculia bacterium]
MSIGSFRFLLTQRVIDARKFDEARRRIDQILFGIEQLLDAITADWIAVELPPLEAAEAEPETSRSVTVLRRLVARIAELASADGPSTRKPRGPDGGDAPVAAST